MNNRKIPMRTCSVTGEKLPKRELIRVVRTPEGMVIIDDTENGKTNGRGAYLKKDIETIEKAEKSKVLCKKLEMDIPSSIYTQLRSKVGE